MNLSQIIEALPPRVYLRSGGPDTRVRGKINGRTSPMQQKALRSPTT